MPKEDFIKIGKITSSRGLKGDLRIYLYTEIANLNLYKKFYLENSDIIDIKFHLNQSKNNTVIATVTGINDRTQADILKNKNIYIKKGQLPKIKNKDTYYITELITLQIIDQNHTVLGTIIDVIDHGAGDNLIIEFNDNNVAEYPFLKTIFTKIDLKNKNVTFIPPEIF